MRVAVSGVSGVVMSGMSGVVMSGMSGMSGVVIAIVSVSGHPPQ
jgi:hypothetical protein